MENKNHDADNDFLCAVHLQRIANSLETMIKMIKRDQEKFERYKEETTEKWEQGLVNEQKN